MLRFVKSVLLLLGGTSIAYGVTLAATPLVAKLYGPAAFGVWAGWFSLSGIIGNVACLRYDTAVALPHDDRQALSVAVVSILLAVAISSIAGALLISLWLLNIDGPWKGLGGGVIGVACGALVIAWAGVLTQWLARAQQVASLARAKILTSAVSACAQAGLGWSGAAGALIFGDIAGRSVGLLSQFKVMWKQSAGDLATLRPNDLREAFIRYRTHSLWLTPTALLDVLGQQAPVLLMLAWYGDAVGGQFSLVQRLLAMPVALIGQSVAQLYLPAMVRAQRSSSKSALSLFATLSALLSVIGVCIIAGVSFIKESWLVILLGAQWQGIGNFLMPLSILSAAQLLSSTLSQAAIVLGAQKWFSLWVFSWVAASMGGMYIGRTYAGVEGAIWGLTIGSGGTYLILWIGLMIGVFTSAAGERRAGRSR
jgi:O-antigen/teichoic acid export membrane protein